MLPISSMIVLTKGDEAGLCQLAAQNYVCFMSEL